MKLSEKNLEILKKKFDEYKETIKPCPFCDTTKWIGPTLINEVWEYNQGKLVVGGSVFPIFPIVCETCGYTMFFNAIIFGLDLNEMQEDK